MARGRSKAEIPSDPDLTEAEWAVMRVVWKHQPCAAGTVQEELARSRGWAYSTVKTTMDRMAGKGLLASRRIRNLQLFTAAVSEPQARRGELRKMLQRAFEGAMAPFLQFLADHEELTDDELRQLKQIVKKSRSAK